MSESHRAAPASSSITPESECFIDAHKCEDFYNETGLTSINKPRALAAWILKVPVEKIKEAEIAILPQYWGIFLVKVQMQ